MSTQPTSEENNPRRAGLGYGIAAYLLWGFLPLLFAIAAPTGALELVSHRVVWSLVFCLVLLAIAGRIRSTLEAFRSGTTFWLLALAAVLIFGNWTSFIYGVETNHLVEVSLGYYINPLLSIGLAVIFLKEKLRPLQWVAVAVGIIAVVVVGAGIGRLPWLALLVSVSFAFYGLVKSKVGSRVAALEGMTVETAVLAVPSLIILAVIGSQGMSTFTGHGSWHVIVVLATGPLTAIPLILFGSAARRIPLSWVGMLQYIAPTLQFIIGITLLGEHMSLTQWIGFFIVWIAVALLSIDMVRANRRR